MSISQADEATGANASEDAEPDTTVSAPPASVLAGAPTAFVNADVALDGEPVVGSFTVDGLTFAVTEGSNVQLVGVSPSWQQATGLPAAEGSSQSSMPASEAEGSDADSSALLLPETAACNSVEYSVISISAYAFYLSGVTSVELPASVADVDDRTFRSSDIASVEVAEGNPNYSSFDGALYDADQSSLLLIPEGKQGTVLLPKEAESAAPSVFSHCPLVTQVSVEEGSAAFASENGLLYDASLTTLLRVPAGAIDITIREGCTTIAAGALEACASLATINAPASVTFISPDVFTSVPTVNLPAAFVADDAKEFSQAEEGEGADGAEGEASDPASTQLTALVALSSTDDDLPEVDASAIYAIVPNEAISDVWERMGIQVRLSSGFDSIMEDDSLPLATYEEASTYGANSFTLLNMTGSSLTFNYRASQSQGTSSSFTLAHGQSRTLSGHHLSKGSLQYTFVYINNTQWPRWGSAQSNVVYDATVDGWSVWTYWLIQPGKTCILWGQKVSFDVVWDANGGSWDGAATKTSSGATEDVGLLSGPTSGTPNAPSPMYRFAGWSTDPSAAFGDMEVQPTSDSHQFYAVWKPIDCDLSFDTSSEPGSDDYPGDAKDDQTITGDRIEAGDKVEIEDPKRPGYVFQGWTIPNAEGTEAIDQDLVYKDETDGKWYVDASKLPDYANDEGRVELTARWTSVISVDVPSAVTFYADVVTQGNESREGAASSAFGQNKVASQSEVDLRIVGLESNAVETQGSTLGADSILKKATSATPSSSTQKLFSLYPANEALTPDDLQDPDAVSAAKPTDAVDFALDDILLERSFAADKFTIPAGDTLNLGYRLNLSETGTELDYEKLSTLDEGQSASIANISYCFAANYDSPADWGEPLWIENPDTSEGAPRFLVLDDIKAAAEDLSAKGEASPYFATYDALMRAVTSEMVTDPAYDANSQRFFQLRVGDSYVPVQVIGICDDVTTDGKKAGLTFQLKNACRTTGQFYPSTNAAFYGWNDGSHPNGVREWLRGAFWESLPSAMRSSIKTVVKHQQVYEEGGANALPTTAKGLQGPTQETLFLPSAYEIFGDVLLRTDNGFPNLWFHHYGSEALTTVSGYAPMRYDWYATKHRTSSMGVEGVARNYNGAATTWWTRSAIRTTNSTNFLSVYRLSSMDNGASSAGYGVVPCFAL